jgi:hypothetical protein
MTSEGVTMLGEQLDQKTASSSNRFHHIQELEEPSGLPEPRRRGVYE